MKNLLIRLLTKLVNTQRVTPYRYDRDIQGHEAWVIRTERNHNSTALYVVIEKDGNDHHGVITVPDDHSQPIQVDIDGIQSLEFMPR